MDGGGSNGCSMWLDCRTTLHYTVRRKPVLTHASIVCTGMLASVNSVNFVDAVRHSLPAPVWRALLSMTSQECTVIEASENALCIASLPQLVFIKPSSTVGRCLNGRAPLYLSDCYVPVAGADTRRQLRSSNRQLLAVTVPRYRLNTYGSRAFSVESPTLWNSLPEFIQDPTISADCFRRLLQTYLFALY